MQHPSNGQNKHVKGEPYRKPAAWKQMQQIIKDAHPDIADLMGEVELIANGYPRDMMAAALYAIAAADEDTRSAMVGRWIRWSCNSDLDVDGAYPEVILREDRAILNGRDKRNLVAIERKLAGIDEREDALHRLKAACGPDGLRCQHCGKPFQDVSRLRLHLRRKHADYEAAGALDSKGLAVLGIS